MKCLNCQKDFSPKKATAKYCSDSCRVMYNRKNGKKKAVTSVQMQALYNSMMEAVEAFKSLPLPADYQNIKSVGILGSNGQIIPLKPTQHPLKSFDYYRAAKREVNNEEDWQAMKVEILKAPNLSDKQKNLLLTVNNSNL